MRLTRDVFLSQRLLVSKYIRTPSPSYETSIRSILIISAMVLVCPSFCGAKIQTFDVIDSRIVLILRKKVQKLKVNRVSGAKGKKTFFIPDV
jgi:hypothetical protein